MLKIDIKKHDKISPIYDSSDILKNINKIQEVFMRKEKKRYTIRFEESVEDYIEQLALERGIKPVNVIREIVADKKRQDERRLKCK